MKLINSLYKVLSKTVSATGFECEIELNPEHEIYKAHFPGNPVTPGVVQLQIVEELIVECLGLKLALSKVTHCKFMAIVNPFKNNPILIRVKMNSRTAAEAVLPIHVVSTSDSGNHMEARAEFTQPLIQ